MPGNFPERLRKLRDDKGLSQTDLAEKSGLQAAAISHFETGKRSPSFANLKRLADALSTSIDSLLERDSEPKAAGPVVDQLFRDFNKMTAADQAAFVKMAEMLASKNELEQKGKE